MSAVGARATYTLGAKVFDHLQDLSLLFHTRRSTGDLVRRTLTDATCARELILSVVVPVVTSLVTLSIMFAVMWRLDRTLSLVAIGVALPLGVLIRVLYGPMSRRAHEQEAVAAELMVLSERTLGAVPVVQMFSLEAENDRAFRDTAVRQANAALRTTASQLQFKIGTGAVTAAGTAVVIIVGGMHVLDGTLALGSLLVFISYLASLYAPMEALAFVSTMLASASAGAKRVLEVLDSQEQVKEAPNAKPLVRSRDGGCAITLKGVTFGYETGRPVLSDVTLEVPAGKTVALVGPTGAGKSTLASLVPRLVDPWSGKVLIDGQDVRGLTLSSVRGAVAVVPQEPLLLPLTIRQNIAYGCPSATEEQVHAAAEAAAASEFVHRLPQGYETVIGERGCTLSAGQRQRMAIARALLRQASVLVLDEPTSALDAGSESLVVRGLRERTSSGKLTVLVIAHRLSTVREADLVVVLDNGRIVEQGTPQELLRSGGLFSRFNEIQSGASELEAVTS